MVTLKFFIQLLLLICIAATGGCSSMPQADLSSLQPSPTGSRVYLLRGITGQWSTGLDEMGETLNSQNIPAHVLDHQYWKRVLAAIESHPQEQAILIGHSLGADRALDILNRIEKDQPQSIALVITIDPVSPPKVYRASGSPVVNFYIRSNSPIPAFRGVEVTQKKSPSGSRISNIDLRGLNSTSGEPLTHFTLDNDPAVKLLILRHVFETLPTPGAK